MSTKKIDAFTASDWIKANARTVWPHEESIMMSTESEHCYVHVIEAPRSRLSCLWKKQAAMFFNSHASVGMTVEAQTVLTMRDLDNNGNIRQPSARAYTQEDFLHIVLSL